MKLYGSLTSPYVRKARVLIREKSLACEFVVADAWAADSAIRSARCRYSRSITVSCFSIHR